MMTTTQSFATKHIYATARPLEIVESAFVKLCGRCGIHYETKTRRTPTYTLCTDCRDVCSSTERRTYKAGK